MLKEHTVGNACYHNNTCFQVFNMHNVQMFFGCFEFSEKDARYYYFGSIAFNEKAPHGCEVFFIFC